MVILTNHALERAKEIKMTKEQVLEAFDHADKSYNPRREIYKLSKYGETQDNICYYRTRKLNFVVKEDGDNQIIITVTHRRRLGELKAKRVVTHYLS